MKNAVNDAKAVKEALESRGVQVFDVYDCNIAELRAKENEFVGALQEGDAAIVYFAGAAAEYNNATRLLAISEDKPDFRKDTLNVLALKYRSATSCCCCNHDNNHSILRQAFRERDFSQHYHS